MDIELLRTFLEVRNTRHFGKAANNLFITQAAVSSRIKQLEQMLGAPLFVRYRNNLQLTETGERLVVHAEGILQSWEEARKDLEVYRDSKKRMVRFGATAGFCAFVLERNLATFYTSIKDMCLRAESLDEETLITRLRDRRLDLALLFDSSRHSDYVSVPVSSSELILVSTHKGADARGALNAGYVAVDWGAFFSVRHQKLFPDTPPPLLQTTLPRVALHYILSNGGSAYLPYGQVVNHLGKELVKVEDAPVIHQPIYAIYHEDSPSLEQIQRMIEIIRATMTPYTTTLEEVETLFVGRDKRLRIS